MQRVCVSGTFADGWRYFFGVFRRPRLTVLGFAAGVIVFDMIGRGLALGLLKLIGWM